MSPPTGWQLIVSRSVLTMVDPPRPAPENGQGFTETASHFGAVAIDATAGFDVPVFWRTDIDATNGRPKSIVNATSGVRYRNGARRRPARQVMTGPFPADSIPDCSC